MSLIRLFALSSSRTGNTSFLETAVPEIALFLGNKLQEIAFLPFASASKDYEAYANRVQEAFKDYLFRILVTLPENAASIIERSDVIMVGGGNTFKLLHDIYELKIVRLLQRRIREGIPYVGWSAGSNILGPTIGTTNDMPVIEPESFKALALLPFQINPHYSNWVIPGFNGETRDERLAEYLKMNPTLSVAGLPEGTFLVLEKGRLKFKGTQSGSLFRHEENTGKISRDEILPDSDVSFLLDRTF